MSKEGNETDSLTDMSHLAPPTAFAPRAQVPQIARDILGKTSATASSNSKSGWTYGAWGGRDESAASAAASGGAAGIRNEGVGSAIAQQSLAAAEWFQKTAESFVHDGKKPTVSSVSQSLGIAKMTRVSGSSGEEQLRLSEKEPTQESPDKSFCESPADSLDSSADNRRGTSDTAVRSSLQDGDSSTGKDIASETTVQRPVEQASALLSVSIDSGKEGSASPATLQAPGPLSGGTDDRQWRFAVPLEPKTAPTGTTLEAGMGTPSPEPDPSLLLRPEDKEWVFHRLGVSRKCRNASVMESLKMKLDSVQLDLVNQTAVSGDCWRATCLSMATPSSPVLSSQWQQQQSQQISEGSSAAPFEQKRLREMRVMLLERVLTLFCKEHSCKYKQGLHDMAAPFVALCHGSSSCGDAKTGFEGSSSASSSSTSLASLELCLTPAEAYVCFEGLVEKFMPCIKLDRDLVVQQELCRLTGLLIKFHEPALSRVLEDVGMVPDLYAIEWYVTLYGSLFSVGRRAGAHACVRLWCSWTAVVDVVFFGLAWLLSHANDIVLCGAVPEMPQYLRETIAAVDTRKVSIPGILDRADALKRFTPPSFLQQVTAVLTGHTEEATAEVLKSSSCVAPPSTNLLDQAPQRLSGDTPSDAAAADVVSASAPNAQKLVDDKGLTADTIQQEASRLFGRLQAAWGTGIGETTNSSAGDRAFFPDPPTSDPSSPIDTRVSSSLPLLRKEPQRRTLTCEAWEPCLLVDPEDCRLAVQGSSLIQPSVIIDTRPMAVSKEFPIDKAIKFDLSVLNESDKAVMVERAKATQRAYSASNPCTVLLLCVDGDGSFAAPFSAFLTQMLDNECKGVAALRGGYNAYHCLMHGGVPPPTSAALGATFQQHLQRQLGGFGLRPPASTATAKAAASQAVASFGAEVSGLFSKVRGQIGDNLHHPTSGIPAAARAQPQQQIADDAGASQRIPGDSAVLRLIDSVTTAGQTVVSSLKDHLADLEETALARSRSHLNSGGHSTGFFVREEKPLPSWLVARPDLLSRSQTQQQAAHVADAVLSSGAGSAADAVIGIDKAVAYGQLGNLDAGETAADPQTNLSNSTCVKKLSRDEPSANTVEDKRATPTDDDGRAKTDVAPLCPGGALGDDWLSQFDE